MTDGEGGDPVCWIARVCPECGLFAEEEPPTACARCGTALPSPPGDETEPEHPK